MQRALDLAAKGSQKVSPNPKVGCVIVKNHKILSEGYHKKFGGDHAEINALKKIKFNAKGATLYVTLEPCHHFGKTPPCVEAVIKSGVARVVVAMRDPNTLTSGRSIRKLKQAGIEVMVGVLKKEAEDLNSAFVKVHKTGLPYVIGKVAQSLDGKIAFAKGRRTQITGKVSFEYVQNLRQNVDAVLIGRGTLEIDNPKLNVRDAKKFQPKRVVLDSKLQISLQSQIFKIFGGDVILVCGLKKTHKKVLALQKKGIIVICVSGKSGMLPLRSVLKKLVKFGVNSILVEGGSEVFTSFAKLRFVDEWHFLVAPKVLGEMAVPAFLTKVDFSTWCCLTKDLGKDRLLKYYKSSV